jgi:hypothetical protein
VESTNGRQTSQELVAEACAKEHVNGGEGREENVEGEHYLQKCMER